MGGGDDDEMNDHDDETDETEAINDLNRDCEMQQMPIPVDIGSIQPLTHNAPIPIPPPAQSPIVASHTISGMALGVGATGTVFRLQFLGSVEVDEEGGRKRRKRLKKLMVEEAVTKIKVCPTVQPYLSLFSNKQIFIY